MTSGRVEQPGRHVCCIEAISIGEPLRPMFGAMGRGNRAENLATNRPQLVTADVTATCGRVERGETFDVILTNALQIGV